MSTIPQIGLGTYRLFDKSFDIVSHALSQGYRHIDTAFIYKNEQDIGKALQKSGVDRKDIFLTTKIWIKDMLKGRKGVINSVKKSLVKLGVGYIDLILLHAPIPETMHECWETLEDIVLGNIEDLKGTILHIGVSNFRIRDLQPIVDNCRILPFCNQIELHPFLPRRELVIYCRKHGITVVAHSSLIQGKKFDDDKLKEIACRYNLKVYELLLVWALHKNYVIIPRTQNIEHLYENILLFGQNILDNNIQRRDNIVYDLDTEITEQYTLFEKYL